MHSHGRRQIDLLFHAVDWLQLPSLMSVKIVSRPHISLQLESLMQQYPLMNSYLPDTLTWCLANLFDGSTLLLVFIPACTLAGAITVMGKLTLSTAVKIDLTPETAVAHLVGQTERQIWSHQNYWRKFHGIMSVNVVEATHLLPCVAWSRRNIWNAIGKKIQKAYKLQ